MWVNLRKWDLSQTTDLEVGGSTPSGRANHSKHLRCPVLPSERGQEPFCGLLTPLCY